MNDDLIKTMKARLLEHEVEASKLRSAIAALEGKTPVTLPATSAPLPQFPLPPVIYEPKWSPPAYERIWVGDPIPCWRSGTGGAFTC